MALWAYTPPSPALEACFRTVAAAAEAGEVHVIQARLEAFAARWARKAHRGRGLSRERRAHLTQCQFQQAQLECLPWAAEHGKVALVWHLCDQWQRTAWARTRHRDVVAATTSALHRAVLRNRLHIVRALIHCELPRGGKVNLAADGSDLLIWAAWNGLIDIVQCFCELTTDRGVKVAANNNAAVTLAARNGHLHVVQFLCELPPCRRVNPGANDNAPVVLAAQNGHLPVVQFLCELPPHRRVNPAACNSLPLRLAAMHDHDAIVRYLCELPLWRNVNPGAANNTILTGLIGRSEADTLRMLRYLCGLPTDRGINPGVHNNYVLRASARQGDLDVLQFLLYELPPDRGIDPTAGDNSALRSAAMMSSDTVDASRYQAIVTCLQDVQAVAQRTSTWELANRIAHHAMTTNNRRIADTMLPFLVQQQPGGDQWLDHGGAFQEHDLKRLADARRGGGFHMLWVAHCRRQRWHRRRTLLMLRLLRGRRRACCAHIAHASQRCAIIATTTRRRSMKRRRIVSQTSAQCSELVGAYVSS